MKCRLIKLNFYLLVMFVLYPLVLGIMDVQKLIDHIRKLYPDSTGEHLFKSCSREWVVILKKINGTITNQSRLPPDNPNRRFAKYRGNKFLVVDIINKFNPSVTTNEIYNNFYTGNKIKYVKGKNVYPDKFDPKLNIINTNGIHFYETIDCAFYLQLRNVKNGKFYSWYDSGQKHSEGEYLNGKKHGKWIQWHENGQKEATDEYLDGVWIYCGSECTNYTKSVKKIIRRFIDTFTETWKHISIL